MHTSKVKAKEEERREGGKEGRREGGKEGRREGGKEGRREGGKEGRRIIKGNNIKMDSESILKPNNGMIILNKDQDIQC